jgi:hypothetical protein
VGKSQRGEGELTWKTRRSWEGVTEVEQEIGWGGEDWIYLAQENKWRAVVNTVMNIRVP